MGAVRIKYRRKKVDHPGRILLEEAFARHGRFGSSLEW
jgi:hypothetical protein